MYIYSLLIYTRGLWYKFSNDLDAQSDFCKIFVTKTWFRWTNIILTVLLHSSVQINEYKVLHKTKVTEFLTTFNYEEILFFLGVCQLYLQAHTSSSLIVVFAVFVVVVHLTCEAGLYVNYFSSIAKNIVSMRCLN